MTATNGIGNDSIIISKKSKNDIGAENTVFKTDSIKVNELRKTVTEHNYSLINWIGGERSIANFKSASGFTVDVDEDLMIDEAQKRLDDHGFNYVIIPSKSHTAERHRFHILLLFSHTVYSAKTYTKIAEAIRAELFPESDPAVTDAGRFVFGSPSTFKAISCFTGKDFNTLAYDDLWTSSTEIISKKEGTVTANDCDGHTECICPFHDDSNASAYVDFNDDKDNQFIYCSACDHTYWMQKDNVDLEESLDEYWSFRDKYYQAGFTEDEFYFNPLGDKKFLLRTNTYGNTNEKNTALAYLAQKKHIAHISRVDYLGNILAEENYFNISTSRGVIEVHYAPKKVEINDNDFIENYLKSRFGEYLTFIKEYLAVFTYTNHEKLPTLVLKGPRGNSKSTFAEFVGSIYQPLTTDWSGTEGMFSYEMEKKFLIVEENAHSDERQYKSLKKYMGQTYVPINKKFKDPFKAKNNMNIIILSNKDIPMYVEKSECPTNSKNNQFYVWEFPPLDGEMDNEILAKLQARLGHYIRTELKRVFDGLKERSKYRYSINVPITEYEKALFDDNISDEELDSIELLNSLYNYKKANDDSNQFFPLLEKGWLPSEFVKSRFNRNYQEVIKELKKQKLLEGNADRRWNGHTKLSSYKMTTKLIDLFTEGQKQLEELED